MRKHAIFALLAIAATIVVVISYPAVSEPLQAVISGGTSVKEKIEFSGPPCQKQYNDCMDQFCFDENESGGRCLCSDEKAKLDMNFSELENQAIETERRAADAIESLESGLKNQIAATETEFVGRAKKQPVQLKSLFEEEPETSDKDSLGLAAQTGVARLASADAMCRVQIDVACDFEMAKLLYLQQVKGDCRAYENAVKKRKEDVETISAEAGKRVRAVALEQYESKKDLGQCIIALRTCATGPDVCGEDWSRCESATLFEKKYICERVLDECDDDARENAWGALVKIALPLVAEAEKRRDSKLLQSCLSEVSACIVKACRDDIAGKGTETMDSCLSRPEMARSFCKVQLDRCESVTQLWDYTKVKLAAMRVDACTAEVKQCFTRDEACGPDWLSCIGLDFDAMHRMCPVDKLVVCKAGNKDFSLSDIDRMVSGIYLSLDNAALDACQKIADETMAGICGATQSCGEFDDDKDIGVQSLRSEKSNGFAQVTGLISWHLVKTSSGAEWSDCVMRKRSKCDGLPRPGDILIDDYLAEFDKVNKSSREASASRERVKSELQQLQSKIKMVSDMLENDTKLSQCVSGRDLSQVSGKAGDKTQGRFPTIMNGHRIAMASSAMRRAAENYAAKLQTMKDEILKEADILNAEYACYMIPMQVESELQKAGIASKTNNIADRKFSDEETEEKPYKHFVAVTKSVSSQDIVKLAGKHTKNEYGDNNLSISYDMTAVFSPDSRNCHVCATRTICGDEKTVMSVKERASQTAVVGGIATAVGGAAVGAAAIAAGVTASIATTAATTATMFATTAAISGSVGATITSVAASAAATVAASTAAGAAAAVPVVGWVVAAVIVTVIVFINWGIKKENTSHTCSTEEKCSDKIM